MSFTDNALGLARRAVRSVRRRPTLGSLVVATLSVAIAATTLIFSFVKVLVLEPLPLASPERVVLVYSTSDERGIDRGGTNLVDFLEWRAKATSFEHLAAARSRFYSLRTETATPLRVRAEQVSASLFPAWGLSTTVGRYLRPGEDAPDATAVVVLSHGFWTRRFGADPSVLGHSIDLDGVPYQVVGVLEPDIEIGTLSAVDVWVPLPLDADAASAHERSLQVTGLLKPGVSGARAQEELAALAVHDPVLGSMSNRGWGVRVLPFNEAMTVPQTWTILGLASLAVVLVFLVACANVATMMITRALERRHEVAVHLALGASRTWIMVPLVLEALGLSLIAGAVGLVLAQQGLELIRAVTYEPFFRLVRLDGAVQLAALTLTVVAPLLFGLAPAFIAAAERPAHVFRTIGAISPRRFFSRWVNPALVVGQLAFAVALSIASVMTGRVALALDSARTNYDATGVVAMRMDFPTGSGGETAQGRPYGTPQELSAAEERLLRLLAVSGDAGTVVAASSALPRVDAERSSDLRWSGHEGGDAEPEAWAVTVAVTRGYFALLRLPVLRGRPFAEGRWGDGPSEAVVSRTLARMYFGSESAALGQFLSPATSEGGEGEVALEIVGVVEDIGTGVNGPKPYVYVPLARFPSRHVTFLLRGAGLGTDESARLAATVARDFDPGLAVEVRPLRSYEREIHANDRLTAGLFSVFAIVALLLAAGGLYGLLSHAVAASTAEIGLRRALGASAWNVLRHTGARTLRMVVLGLVLGFAMASPIPFVFQGWPGGVDVFDPMLYLGVAGVVLAVTLVAVMGPLNTALKFEPIRALRGP
jgi:putative ABC transport system permease protein